MRNHFKTLYRAALTLAVIAYGTSLLLPGLVYSSDPDLQAHLGRPLPGIAYGFQILELGAFGFLLGNFAWLANLLGVIAFLMIAMSGWQKPYAVSAVLTALPLLVGLDAFAFRRTPLDESGSNWLYVDHLGTGFYLWEVSFLLLGLALLAKYLTRQATVAIHIPSRKGSDQS